MAGSDRIIRYNGDMETLAWKYPAQKLTTSMSVMVNNSQEAVLYAGGRAWDCLGAGLHELSLHKLPLFSKYKPLPADGLTPFTAEIWYVNKAATLEPRWGTSSPIQVQDPKLGPCSVRANGQFGVQIIDSGVFLTRLVGTLPSFSIQDVTRYFQGIYTTEIKSAIASYIVRRSISVLEINAYLKELSQFVRGELNLRTREFGIQVISFEVNAISVDERRLEPQSAASREFCSGCGAQLSPSASFCPGCGKRIRRCRRCSALLPASDANFCHHCGNQLPTQEG